MLKPVEIPKHQQTLVTKKYEVVSVGKSLGEVAILKNGNVVAIATRSGFESVKAAEKWLTYI